MRTHLAGKCTFMYVLLTVSAAVDSYEGATKGLHPESNGARYIEQRHGTQNPPPDGLQWSSIASGPTTQIRPRALLPFRIHSGIGVLGSPQLGFHELMEPEKLHPPEPPARAAGQGCPPTGAAHPSRPPENILN